jgi:hypothetical protein
VEESKKRRREVSLSESEIAECDMLEHPEPRRNRPRKQTSGNTAPGDMIECGIAPLSSRPPSTHPTIPRNIQAGKPENRMSLVDAYAIRSHAQVDISRNRESKVTGPH